MKYLVILLTTITFCTVDIQAQDVQAQKFGHINSQLLLDTLPETTVAQAQLEEMNTEFEKALKEQQTELEKLAAEIQSNPDMTEFVRNTKISKYTADEQRLQDTYQVAQQTLSEKEQELLAPIIEKARAAIKEVGKENGFTYIFDLNNGGIIYDEGGEDVLPLVLKKLGI